MKSDDDFFKECSHKHSYFHYHVLIVMNYVIIEFQMTRFQDLLSPENWRIDQTLKLTYAFYNLDPIFDIICLNY